MRVCMVTTSFPRWKGDWQGSFVFELARALLKKGVQIRVVAMHSPGAAVHEHINGIEIFRPKYWWPERWEMLRKEGGGLPIVWQKYPLARVQILPFFVIHTLATIRYAQSFDIVHAHWTLSAGAACLGRQVHQKPIIVTVQGSDVLQVPSYPVGRWLTRKILSSCDQITALSCALRDKVIALGINPEKVRVIPNGVDTTWFVPPKEEERENLILFVGSLIERKGVKYLISAMPMILKLFPHYRLVIVGEGPQAYFLKELTNKANLTGYVSFVGSQSQEGVRAWMQRAKLLVLPSLEEGMGVVLIEALACGTPVVATYVDGIRDVVTPEVGVLVPPADSEALFKGIQEVLSDHNRWAAMSRSARERAVKCYEWGQIADKFIELYQWLM